jgi:hypothetical protein
MVDKMGSNDTENPKTAYPKLTKDLLDHMKSPKNALLMIT